MLARKTAVFKPCNGQHQRSENPNATPGHSQIFRKITVMVLSGQKWHRNREKTDIYIYIYILLSVQVVLLQQHIKSLSSRLWLFLEVNRSLYACIYRVFIIYTRGDYQVAFHPSPLSSLLVCRPPFSEYLVQRLSE